MTPDTRTTENPEPRTQEGKRLIALLAEYQATADSDYPDKERRTAATEAYRDARQTVKGLLPLIEAEAAQGAAPPAEALDVIQWIRERLDFDPCHECDNATIANDRLDEAEARLRSPESDR